jgi:hypothetical protein
MKILTSVIALVVSASVSAQTPATVVSTTKPSVASCSNSCSNNEFKMDLSTDVNVFKFSSGTIVEADNVFTHRLFDKWNFGIALPIINSNLTNTGTGTGLADLDLFIAYDLYDGNWDLLKSDKTWIDVKTGIGIPIDGEYSSSRMTYTIGSTLGAKWDALTISYTANYEFVEGYTNTFIAPLGGFVSSNVYSGVLSADYQLDKNLSVALNFSQFIANYDTVLLLGPAADYKLSDSCVLTVGVGVPVTHHIANQNLDVAMNAGLSFKF